MYMRASFGHLRNMLLSIFSLCIKYFVGSVLHDTGRGGFECISISLSKSASFSLQTSENNLKISLESI